MQTDTNRDKKIRQFFIPIQHCQQNKKWKITSDMTGDANQNTIAVKQAKPNIEHTKNPIGKRNFFERINKQARIKHNQVSMINEANIMVLKSERTPKCGEWFCKLIAPHLCFQMRISRKIAR